MSNEAPTITTEVLIVGAGPAGAAAAALLSTYGIKNVVVNKYPGGANAPRAHITNQRAVEVFRDLGLEHEVIALSTPQEKMGEHVFATSLTGAELGRLRTWYTEPRFQAEHDLASPSSVCDLPQDKLEPILMNAAVARGTVVRSATEFLSLSQDDEGVSSLVRDRVTGQEYIIRSAYVIGADGGRSVVAEQIGLPFEGEMGLGGSINVVFEADLTHLVEHRQGDMYWFMQPGVGHDGNGIGVLRVVRPWTRWVGVWGYDVSAGAPELTDELGVEIAHQLIGDDSIDVKIESMSTWAVNHMFATDNLVNRVMCVGDAVHRHSPMNGLGSNTSIQDSYNLAWKLMLVLRGKANPSLIDSYRDERVPVARQIVERASRSNGLMPPLFMALDLPRTPDVQTMERAIEGLQADSPKARNQRQRFDKALRETIMGFNTHGVEMNQNYSSQAVVEDGSIEFDFGLDEEVHYVATTRPGRHLPHVWVTQNQQRVAIFDLCGRGTFTLLTGIGGERWRAAAKRVEAEFGVPVQVHTIGRGLDYEDSYGDYAKVAEVDEDGAILVRPDHMIAWRATDSSGDVEQRLVEVFGHILGHKAGNPVTANAEAVQATA
ncbi:hypothetical protein EU811_20600 [Arthrobacter sp. TS-15]|uniref:FAD-dependent monooxygenase n=1 Tax=Arthrobacter sp. TS-15 TaxID=2510797 RepID=UPI00115DEACD|nr:FAD-dependent monooxygenase [Arthrobacter sp. TS-15]TQS88945.1 hypothetical protein EU811_20600 [Arthrobacter sp. TS-15]